MIIGIEYNSVDLAADPIRLFRSKSDNLIDDEPACKAKIKVSAAGHVMMRPLTNE